MRKFSKKIQQKLKNCRKKGKKNREKTTFNFPNVEKQLKKQWKKQLSKIEKHKKKVLKNVCPPPKHCLVALPGILDTSPIRDCRFRDCERPQPALPPSKPEDGTGGGQKTMQA